MTDSERDGAESESSGRASPLSSLLRARARAHTCVRARGEGERILSRGSLSSVASWTHLHMIPHMFRLASHALAEANASHGSDLALRLRLEESHYSLVITRSLTHRAPYFTPPAASFSAKISISINDRALRNFSFFFFFSRNLTCLFSRCAKSSTTQRDVSSLPAH